MSFTVLPTKTGLLLDLSDDAMPTSVYGWNDGDLDLPGQATHYGMVISGSAEVIIPDTQTDTTDIYSLRPGMFFVLPGPGRIRTQSGQGLVVSRLEYLGLRQIGGPIEARGRLVYIDGCSDTLLVCPPRLGEPCLNHLHLPPGTNQTAHTHPSERIGIILRGTGECRTPDGVYPLTAGMSWRIPTGCLHSFFTFDESMDVLAWHPDSDFGPTDDNHPMKNKTFVQGS